MATDVDGSFADRVVLVTGSTSGIGVATAERFARAGARVVLNSRRSVAEGAELARRLDGSIYVQGDVSSEADVGRVVGAAVDAFGRLDVVVNNAAATVMVPHEDLDGVDAAAWDRILSTNVIGPWNVARAAVPHMAHGGVVVNIGSIAGLRPSGSSIPYAVSKAALSHLTALLAKALAPQVRVVCLAPGIVDTDWWGEARGAEMDAAERRVPLGRPATADDVAAACLHAAAMDYLTGTTILLDGGLALVQ